jgi:hypothetical protein
LQFISIISVQDICVAEELVKQGYATWEKSPKDEQQRIAGKQMMQPQTTDSSGNASLGVNSNTVVSASSEQDHKNSMASEDMSKIKSVCSEAHEERLVLDADVRPPAEFLDEYDSEDGLEMG